MIAANLLVIAPYDEWNASALGNRFLFPALASGMVLLAACATGIRGGASSDPARR